jgi:predicted AAA+ superfamily ATPase
MTHEIKPDHVQIIKEVILENAQLSIESILERHTQISVLPGKANILMGVRRSGKTSIFRLLARQMQPENFAFIDFSDDRLHFLNAKNLGLIVEAFVQIKQKTTAELDRIFWFFDEIQLVHGWENFINRLVSSKRNLVFVTGSSAKMLSKEIGTMMRGRALCTEVFPLTFSEICLWNKLPQSSQVSTEHRALMEDRFSQMLVEGAFPEIVLAPKSLHRKILQNYYHTIFYRDVVERHNPSNPQLIRYILDLLINQVAMPYTVNKITERTKAAGYSLQKQTVQETLSWLNDAYLLFTVPILSNSVHKQNTNPKKLYCVDNGIVNAVTNGFSENRGQMLENVVFTILRRKFEKIFYYRDERGFETDFVAFLESSQKPDLCVQVCESLGDPKTRDRELRGLVSAMNDLGIAKGLVVTLSEEETIHQKGLEIMVIPAWKWSLEFEKSVN